MHFKWLALFLVALLCACEAPVPTCEERLASIDTTIVTEREYDGPVDESAEGARIIHGYDASGTLRQVAVSFYGERGRREIVYAIADADTYTMTVRDVTYAQAISPDRPTQDNTVSTHQFAVCGGVVTSRPDDSQIANELSFFISRLPEFGAK